jgi:hypothetical protein
LNNRLERTAGWERSWLKNLLAAYPDRGAGSAKPQRLC